MTRFRQQPNYTRVAAGFTIAGKTSCWLTGDQMVVVEQSHVTESYRRFELRDLQAVLLYQTRTGRVAAWLLLAGTTLFGFLGWVAFRSNASPPATALNLGVAVLLGVSLALHLARGPMARIELRTAVQTFVVPGVHRWRSGLKMFQAVEPAIRKAQPGPAATSESGSPAAPDPAS